MKKRPIGTEQRESSAVRAVLEKVAHFMMTGEECTGRLGTFERREREAYYHFGGRTYERSTPLILRLCDLFGALDELQSAANS